MQLLYLPDSAKTMSTCGCVVEDLTPPQDREQWVDNNNNIGVVNDSAERGVC